MGKPALSPPITLPAGPDYVIELPEGKTLSPEALVGMIKGWNQAYPDKVMVVLEDGMKLRKGDGGNYLDVVDDIIGEPDVIRGDECGPLFSVAAMQSMRPFAYGLAFLLLLWGCVAWEQGILWMM